MKLGGWTRLGIVVSVLYGLVLVAHGYNILLRQVDLEDAWFKKASLIIDTSNPDEVYIPPDLLSGTGSKPTASIREIERFERSSNKALWLEQIANSPTETQKVFSKEIADLNKEYKAEIAELPMRQLKHWLTALGIWAVGVALLFGTGWTIRWVYLGFSKGKT